MSTDLGLDSRLSNIDKSKASGFVADVQDLLLAAFKSDRNHSEAPPFEAGREWCWGRSSTSRG